MRKRNYTVTIRMNKAEYLPMIQVMFGACLRVSETIGLTWSDVDMKNREIHVGDQLVYYEGDASHFFSYSQAYRMYQTG